VSRKKTYLKPCHWRGAGCWRLAAVVDEEAAAAALRPEAAPPTLLAWLPSPAAKAASPPTAPPPQPASAAEALPGACQPDLRAAPVAPAELADGGDAAPTAGEAACSAARCVITRHSAGRTATYLLLFGVCPCLRNGDLQ